MPWAFFSLMRLAGMNVSLAIVILLILGLLIYITFRVAWAILVAMLILIALPFAVMARASGVEQKPLTDEQRALSEKIRNMITSSMQISDGGRYGRQRRAMKAIEARLRQEAK